MWAVLLLAFACTPEPTAAVALAPDAGIDQLPGRRTMSASGRFELIVRPGGELRLREGNNERVLDARVDPRLVVSPDDRFVIYSREGDWATTDLWRVALPDGTPTQLTDWPDSEDRPVLSPDGRQLALVSGRTGIASWWVIDLPTVGLASAGRQLTNINVRRGRPGQAPEGWTPVPDGTVYGWTADGLSWVSEARRWSAEPVTK